MGKIKDITGQKFNRLIAIKFAFVKNKKTYWLFKCDCGKEKTARVDQVLSRDTKSCGCLNWEQLKSEKNRKKLGDASRKHGMSFSKIYSIYSGIKERCCYKKSKHFFRYGGRGIKICKRWLGSNGFFNFKKDMYNSFLKHVKKYGEENTSIDRINNNGNYCPQNCRWATHIEQSNNTSINRLIKYKNKILTMAEWSRKLNVPYYIINNRINRYHWTIEETLTTPYKKNRKLK